MTGEKGMTHEAGIEAATAVYWDVTSDPEGERDMAKAIQAYLSASGMVLAPREATHNMMVAWRDSEMAMQFDHGRHLSLSAGYKAMVAAAPDPFKSQP